MYFCNRDNNTTCNANVKYMWNVNVTYCKLRMITFAMFMTVDWQVRANEMKCTSDYQAQVNTNQGSYTNKNKLRLWL